VELKGIEAGAVRGVILMEKEGGSGVENGVLGQGAELLVVVSVGKIEVGVVEEGMGGRQ
jgi:hypothetical protein